MFAPVYLVPLRRDRERFDRLDFAELPEPGRFFDRDCERADPGLGCIGFGIPFFYSMLAKLGINQ